MKKEIILDLCGGTGSWAKPYKDAGYKVYTITLPEYDICETILSGNFITFPKAKEAGALLIAKKYVYGIIAAPPCTMFSFARTNAKKPRNLKEGMECVRTCLDIIWHCMEIEQPTKKKTLPLQFWALENPYHGFLKKFLGKPAFTFDPWEFGDGYQKRTALWGNFKEPIKCPIPLPDIAKSSTNRGKPQSIWKKEDCVSKEMLAKAKTNSYLHTMGVKFDYLKSKDIHPEHFGKFDRQTRRSITPQGFAQAFFRANP